MSLFVLSPSLANKSQTSMRQEPPKISQMNTDEAFKSHCFWQNPNYFESTMSRRCRSNFSFGSQRFCGQFLMIPNPGFVDISSSLSHQQQQPPKFISKDQKENDEEQHWTIKKELTKSDVSHATCRRLTLPRSSVEEHILKHLPLEDSQNIDRSKPGITVKVYDYDTDTEHELCLVFQRSYVLKDGWFNAFIRRRGLKEGDKVGLFWECSTSKLHFSVLSRAIAKAPA